MNTIHEDICDPQSAIQNLIECKICGELKSINDYYLRSSQSNSSLRRECKECTKARSRARYQKNKDTIRVTHRQYHQRNKEVLNRQRRELYWRMSPKEREDLRKTANVQAVRRQKRKLAEFISENGGPPLCQCGCKTPVGVNKRGTPYKYAPEHPLRELSDPLLVIEDDHLIPLDKVRSSLLSLKKKKNITVDDMVRITGCSPTTVRNLLYSKTYARNGVKRELVEHVFRRLSGMATRPTEYEKKRIANQQAIYLPGNQVYMRR